MTRFATIFFDVGGVCLTNGWDTSGRRSAALHFALDLEEFEERHQALVDALERDEQSLDDYLVTSFSIGIGPFRARASPDSCRRNRSPRLGAEPDPKPRISGLLQARHDQQRVARAEPLSHRQVGLTEQLIQAGVEVPMSGPVSARTYPNGGEHPRRDETAAREE